MQATKPIESNKNIAIQENSSAQEAGPEETLTALKGGDGVASPDAAGSCRSSKVLPSSAAAQEEQLLRAREEIKETGSKGLLRDGPGLDPIQEQSDQDPSPFPVTAEKSNDIKANKSHVIEESSNAAP